MDRIVALPRTLLGHQDQLYVQKYTWVHMDRNRLQEDGASFQDDLKYQIILCVVYPSAILKESKVLHVKLDRDSYDLASFAKQHQELADHLVTYLALDFPSKKVHSSAYTSFQWEPYLCAL